MTEVLTAPSEGGTLFSSGSLRRSSSTSSLFLGVDPPSYADTISSSSSTQQSQYLHRISSSLPSSAPSSPLLPHSFSNEPSCASTPSSSLSLDTKSESDNTDIDFPSFDGPDYFCSPESLEPPPPPLSAPALSNDCDSEISTPLSGQPVPETSQPESSDFLLRDDHAIENEPTRHVDYLSHDWKEEDIWSSWRYISSRRGQFANGTRLENASWRTWTKAKYRLRTVSPEQLNWLKDCDVTWLYGPLQTDSKKHFKSASSPPPSRLSKSNSFLNKKPILKKRSASEAILQRSLSNHTLLKHAGALLQAQEASTSRIRPTFSRSRSDFAPVVLKSIGESSISSTFPSSSSSGFQSPRERRHIHFNSEVSQCIAVEAKEEGEEDEEFTRFDDDDESSDDQLMMKEVPHRAKISNRSTPRASFSDNKPTIAPLPPTVLRGGHTPEPVEPPAQSLLQQAASFWQPSSSKTLAPSPSQETLRPSKPSTNFLLDEDEDADLDWPGPSTNWNDARPDYQAQSRQNSNYNYDPGPGMRRTPSGMFMPYEDEDEDDIVAAGLFGRVVDTVNTARDIAHVIWNVGWRK